jgi:CDP-diglyceride synthetase
MRLIAEVVQSSQSCLNMRVYESFKATGERFIADELWKAYPIPIAVALLAWLPVDLLRGIMFSPHGGFAWIVLLLAFPWLLVRAAMLALSAVPTERRRQRKMSLLIVIGYPLLSVICVYSLVRALNPPLNEGIFGLLPWFYFPLSLLTDGW